MNQHLENSSNRHLEKSSIQKLLFESALIKSIQKNRHLEEFPLIMQRSLWIQSPSSSRNKFEATFKHLVSSEIFELTKNSFWEKSQDGKIFKTSFSQHLDNFSLLDLNFFFAKPTLRKFSPSNTYKISRHLDFFEDSSPLGKFHRFRIILQPLFIIEFENICIRCPFWRSTKVFFHNYEFLLWKKPAKRKITIEVSEITRRKKASDQNIRIKQPWRKENHLLSINEKNWTFLIFYCYKQSQRWKK